MKIDGKPIVEPTVQKTIKLVRGEPDTMVSVTIYRPGTKQTLDFSLKRARINLDSVRNATLLPGGLGYLQLTQFSERTGKEFPADPVKQLEGAIGAVFNSWMGKRAIDYRREFRITPAMAMAPPSQSRHDGRRPSTAHCITSPMSGVSATTLSTSAAG